MNRHRVVACVITRGDRVLVCQRQAQKRHGGLWEFPGGKLEPGEADREAAARELAEELDVEVVASGEPDFEIDDEGSDFTIAFVPVHISGEPLCLEHSNLLWASRADLMRIPLAPSDAAYVKFRLSSGGV